MGGNARPVDDATGCRQGRAPRPRLLPCLSMAQERRNFYRILQVQPEAPSEVIKASYRAMMTTLRAHPDHGGDHEAAAQLNAAYAVLSDPQRRAAYDKTLRRATTGPATTAKPAYAAAPDPQDWLVNHRCPFCGKPWAGTRPKVASHCHHCESPLTPAPTSETAGTELLGRRRGQRFARVQDAHIRLTPAAEPVPARIKDLSLSGLAFVCRHPVVAGQALRVSAQGFESVVLVVGSRASGSGYTVHARLLTLHVVRSPTGTFVSAKV